MRKKLHAPFPFRFVSRKINASVNTHSNRYIEIETRIHAHKYVYLHGIVRRVEVVYKTNGKQGSVFAKPFGLPLFLRVCASASRWKRYIQLTVCSLCKCSGRVRNPPTTATITHNSNSSCGSNSANADTDSCMVFHLLFFSLSRSLLRSVCVCSCSCSCSKDVRIRLSRRCVSQRAVCCWRTASMKNSFLEICGLFMLLFPYVCQCVLCIVNGITGEQIWRRETFRFHQTR